MKAINFVKTNYKYCVLGEKEHKEYPLPSDSFYNQNTDYLGEPTSKSDGEIEKNISMNTSFNDILDVDSHLDLRTMIIYSLPSFGKMSSIVMLNIHAMLLYESIGAKIIYMSFFTSLARAIEIIIKPIIAHISDNMSSKYGRRKPFMFVGCIFYVIFLLLIFSPPFLSEPSHVLTLWFGIFYVLFFIADTVVNVPYLAFGPELSKYSYEREQLYVWFYIFQYIGVLVAASSPVLLVKLMGSDCDCSSCYITLDITNIEMCIQKCELFCNMQINLKALKVLSYIICIEFSLTILLLCIFVKEPHNFNDRVKTKQRVSSDSNLHKKLLLESASKDIPFENKNELESLLGKNEFVINKKDRSSNYMIPKLYNLMRNKPFKKLFLPWILDLTVVTIFSTMLPFYLNVIINPQKYCVDNNFPLNSFFCNTQVWLGISISVFFITCIISMAGWHLLVIRLGKKKCWKIVSILSIFSFGCFSFCGFGTMERMVCFSILTAIPAGGSYLNDVFVTDIIDYDEFITGKRNEGLYTVFISFVPKFVSVMSQSLPISIIALLGYQASEDGVIKDQPDAVKFFIKFFFIWIPSCLSFISYLFKRDYPIESNKNLEDIQKMISLRKSKYVALRKRYQFYFIEDPIFNDEKMIIFANTPEQKRTKLLFDHFSDKDYFKYFLENKLEDLKDRVIGNIWISFVFFILVSLGTVFTFNLLDYQGLNFLPVLLIFMVSGSIVFLSLYIIRYRVLKDFISNNRRIDHEFLKILVLKYYCENEDLNNAIEMTHFNSKIN